MSRATNRHLRLMIDLARARLDIDELRSGILAAIATGESMEAPAACVLVKVLDVLRETRDALAPPRTKPPKPARDNDRGSHPEDEANARHYDRAMRDGPYGLGPLKCRQCSGNHFENQCPKRPTMRDALKPLCGQCGGAHYDVKCPKYIARAKAERWLAKGEPVSGVLAWSGKPARGKRRGAR